jgi:Cu+-exporting ATPase
VKGCVDVKKAEYDVLGMHCVSCSTAISKLLSKTKGVSDVEVTLTESKIAIEYDENVVDDKKIVEQVGRLGYKAVERKK